MSNSTNKNKIKNPITKVVSIRFKKNDELKLKEIYKTYQGSTKSKILRDLILSERNPVISSKEKDLIMTLIVLLDELQTKLNYCIEYQCLSNINDIKQQYAEVLKTLYEKF